MKTKSKKSNQAKKQTQSSAEMWSAALDHENAAEWSEAAKLWSQLAKVGSKKERADAACRAAAAKVRAEAKAEPVVVEAPQEQPTPVEPPPVGPAANAAGSMEEETVESPTSTDAPIPPAAPAAAPSEPDPRMPAIGTMIQKRDRKGQLRCECTVVDGGIEYKGTTYKSLSAAALASARDLGLQTKTVDGWAWWGLKSRTAGASKKSVVESLERAFEKYRARVEEAVEAASAEDAAKLRDALRIQSATLGQLAAPPAAE